MKRQTILQLAILAALVLTINPAFAGRIIYVDADVTGAKDGSSWANAYKYLQDALAAAYSGDEIRVAQGTYKPDQGAAVTPGDREATFQLINGVTIKGGYAGTGEPDPNARDIKEYRTFLSGDLAGDDSYNFANRKENSYHIVTGSETDTTAVLDGFYITRGHANRQADPWGAGMYNDYGSPTVKNCAFVSNYAFAEQGSMGGGMYNYGSSPVLINCRFNGNSADVTDKNQAGGNGAGMCNHLSSPTLTNCTFRSNDARDYGGGMYNNHSNPTLTNCTFTCNMARDGGGMFNSDMSSPVLTNCTFSENIAVADEGSFGGGMYNDNSSPILTNCTFTRNLAYVLIPDHGGGDGGGMYNEESSPTLTNCTFSGNTARCDGGGMGNCWRSSPLLKNCIFTGNSAAGSWGRWGEGGGMYNYYWCSPVLINCTFTANSAITGGALYNSHNCSPTLTNCILWDDTPGEISGTAVVTYSDVQGGWPGQGNIDADPLFVDANNGNYHLLEDSPCIDAGDPNYIVEPNETDLDGRPRVIRGRIDMGAYEYSPSILAEVRIAPRTINLTSKGNWITCYIWLGEDYNVADIEPNSVLLEGEIKPEEFSVDQQKQVAVLRFSREDVQPILEVGDIDLTIIGRLTDGTAFDATDTIKVIDKARKK